jgi:hypothetical protein
MSAEMVDTQFLDNVRELVREMSASASPRRAIEFSLSPKASYSAGIEPPVTGGAAY